MRWVTQAAFVALLVTTGASAQTMKAIRKGLLCERADALAKLTLPDGSSRTSASHPNKNDVMVKEAGGCIDIPDGAVVRVQTRRKQTSIVILSSNGIEKTYITPNIDYTEVITSAQPTAPRLSPQIPAAQRDNPTAEQTETLPDVTGIRLGMTLKQAQSIIGSDYKYSSRDGKAEGVGPDVEMLLASKNPSPGQQPEAARTLDGYVLLALDDKLFFVEHGQTFADTDMPNTQRLEAALADKYGRPSSRFNFGGGGSLASMTRWLYSSSNQLISPTNAKMVAAQRAACQFEAGISIEQGDAGLVIPKVNDFRGPQGACVFAQINPAPNQQFVHLLTVYLSDQGPMLQRLAQLQKEQDAQAKAAVESAKTKVPQL